RELRLQRLRPLPDDAAQPLRLPAQLLLGQRREPLRDLVDLRDQRLKPLDLTVVPRPEKPAYQGLQHWISDVYGMEGRRIPVSYPAPTPPVRRFRRPAGAAASHRGGHAPCTTKGRRFAASASTRSADASVMPAQPPHRPRHTGRAHG